MGNGVGTFVETSQSAMYDSAREACLITRLRAIIPTFYFVIVMVI